MILLFTGATGFIGKELLKNIASKFSKIYVIIRPETEEKNLHFLQSFKNIECIKAELHKPYFNLEAQELHKIMEEVTHVIHAAAVYDLQVDFEKSYEANILGSLYCVQLSNECKKLKVFHYISTYAMHAGALPKNQSKHVLEEELLNEFSLDNHYVKTKFAAENIVRSEFKGELLRIYRPGIVIGSSADIHLVKYDGPYFFINRMKKFSSKKFLANLWIFIPISYEKKASLPFIPLDFLVQWCSEMIKNPKSEQKKIRTYHLFSTPVEVTTFLTLVSRALEVNWFFINVKIPLVLMRLFFKLLGLPSELLSYLKTKTTYSTNNREVDYPDLAQYDVEHVSKALFQGIKK
jgi:nucleoside-diphosphate-sugar epimerase